jgi:DNA-binding transcriptional LysR family regulator
MDIVETLRAFVATAQAGSFTGAADQLGVSNRLTSKYVAELEERLGVRLLQRTTRRVGITPAGEALLARAPAILDELDELLAGASEEARGLSGLIRVSAPVTFGETYVAAMLSRFIDQHPGVTVDLRLDDAYVDLATAGIDLAFRIGSGNALAVKARRLGEMRVFMVASPGYLSENGVPQTPDELSGHVFIRDSNLRNQRRWMLKRDSDEVSVDPEGNFTVNSARIACELAAAGRGIAFTPLFASSHYLASGKLQAILPEYEGEPGSVSAVYLEGRGLPRRLRALIEFAATDFKDSGFV